MAGKDIVIMIKVDIKPLQREIRRALLDLWILLNGTAYNHSTARRVTAIG